jgi:two-component system, OmpR family, phosphate regulon sensor histidine kinase PhoR
MLVLRGVAQPGWLRFFSPDRTQRWHPARPDPLELSSPMPGSSPARPLSLQPADIRSKLLGGLAAALSFACLGLWLAVMVLPVSGLPAATAWAIGPGMALAGVCAWRWNRCLIRNQRQAIRFFDELSRRDPHDAGVTADAARAILPSGSPWYPIANRFAERCRLLAERGQDVEQSRAALEIRLRRNAVRQRQTDAILANLGEPVIAINSFDEVVLINDAARRLFEISEESIVGQPIVRAIPCEKVAALLIDARRRGTPAQRTAEVEWIDSTGVSKWFGAMARSLSADDRPAADEQRSLGAFVALRDIAEIKTGQKRYAEFVSAVSHEMKSPLTGIKAYVELLADCDPSDSAAREEFLGVIDSQANRLQRLIDNLLNIARIEAGVVEVSKQSISLHELLGEALEIVRPSADAKRIRLLSELSPMYLSVLADRDMLMQVAINLLSNAIKYTPEQGSVTLRSRMADEEVEFEIADTGVGLSAEDRVKVFEKFYRVKKDRGMAQGTGLGLPLAKHIVEDVHGGRITVESVAGGGSVFRVSLPAVAQLVS